MSKKENISGYTAEILIAEDSPTQAAQIQYLLESHQYKVTVTQNGLQALDWISGHKPSLVITDIIMPEMNGFELCEKINEQGSRLGVENLADRIADETIGITQDAIVPFLKEKKQEKTKTTKNPTRYAKK